MHNRRDAALVEYIAYHLWVREGRPDGRSHEHWIEAERQLEIEFRMGFPDAAVAESLDGEESRQAH
jgi:Protein of unknown function (DUF2934)